MLILDTLVRHVLPVVSEIRQMIGNTNVHVDLRVIETLSVQKTSFLHL